MGPFSCLSQRQVGYDEEGGESETGTEDGEVPVMPVPSPAAPDKKPVPSPRSFARIYAVALQEHC